MESNFKTLLFIKEKGKLRIHKLFLKPISGFSRLRKQGLIRIHKENSNFYASITDKGEEFIITIILLKFQGNSEIILNCDKIL